MSTPNPFSDVIVKDPRDSGGEVPGLNDAPLQAVLDRFAPLSEDALPRPLRAAEQALLVVSEQPGYGKSHLISRLFRALHGRASLIYVQPFQNAGTAFHSLMMAVVRELHFPDRAAHGAWDRDEPTQLDLLAHAVLAHLLADLVEGRSRSLQIDTPAETAQHLRKDPVAAFQRGADPWAGWLTENWRQLEPYFEEALARRGLSLAQPGSWLRVLRAYAFAPFDPSTRRTCLDWLTGQPFDRAEAEAIGLRPGDAPPGESSPRESNVLCRSRLMELCQLASFFRPFVFTFDQTEVYGHHPALARTFGLVVATLVHEAPGQLILITANQSPWKQKVVPYIEDADLQRILFPPLVLAGLNREQAIALANLRLDAAKADAGARERFLAASWLNELFPTERNQMGARLFLQKAQQRWANAPPREESLETLYARHEEQLRRMPKQLGFNPDSLQWLVEVAGAGRPGVEVLTLDERYFSVQWKSAERITLFGFIASSHWRTWEAIARQSVDRLRGGAPQKAKSVFLRTTGEPAIPGANWKVREEIEAAQREALEIIVLAPEELAALYAARELFAEAVQGDIAYSQEEVVAFLHQRLASWWERFERPLLAADGGAAGTTPAAVVPAPEPAADLVMAEVAADSAATNRSENERPDRNDP